MACRQIQLEGAVQFLQAFFAPSLDCYLHYRILPAEKAVPFLLAQANGTTACA